MRLLVVEDEIYLAEYISEALEDSGYVVDVAHDGEAGWVQAKAGEYAAILLDWMLPKLDGVQLCQRLRSQGSTVPILMMTARDSSSEKVKGLDAGADDYLVKPLDLPELLARIRAVLRRGQNPSTAILNWGELRLYPDTHDVTYAHKPVLVTPKEFSLLELLLRNDRRVLSQHVIISQLWNFENSPGEYAVKAHIKGLRQKLNSVGAPTNTIETVRGVGYRLGSIC